MLSLSSRFLKKNISLYNSFPKHLSSSSISANDIFEKSCYHKINFKINRSASVNEAVFRFSTFNIGCLAVTDDSSKLIGVFTEGDFINRVASLNKNADTTLVQDVCTLSPNVIVAKKSDSLDDCMNKMILKDLRHLLVIDEKNDSYVGMISIRDLVKEVNKKNKDTIARLSDFNIGKGAFFGSE